MGIHTHELTLPSGALIPLAASAGPAHVHTGSHADLGGDFVTSEFDDAGDHTHLVVTPDQNFQTGRPIEVEQGSIVPTESVERVRPIKADTDILTWGAVRSGTIPELGISGLPESLAKGIPAQFRYWNADTMTDALAIRRALVCCGIVDGSLIRSVQVKSVDGVSEPCLMRVVRHDDGQLVPVRTLPDGPVTVPGFESDISLATKAVGLDGTDAEIIDAKSLVTLLKFGNTTPDDVIRTCMDSSGDWLLECGAGTATEEALLKRYDASTVFRLNHTDDHSYIGSRVPDTGVRFITDPGTSVKSALERTQTLSGPQIDLVRDQSDLGSGHRFLSATAGTMARKSDWSDTDLRYGTRIRGVIERELSRGTEQRVSLVKSLGLDTDAAGQMVLARTDKVQIRKFADTDVVIEHRLVYGVVLEPDTRDLQGDVMSAEDIAESFYDYVENHRNRGVQHLEIDNGGLRITQMYIAPCDFIPRDCPVTELIREGSWVMEYRIIADELWYAIKRGEFTGFSIGGSGTRIPI
jgi:hypothetical protein